MIKDRLVLSAPAKVNLYLNVTGRREDGYHCLATLMQKISLCDRIVLEKSSSGINLQCPDSRLPVNRENLVYRAAALFFATMSPRMDDQAGVDIVLHKSIPVAAGLGGGSSDAGTVLRGLDRMFHTGCSSAELIELGTALGADVPFFTVDWPVAWATGIGDVLQRAVPLAGYLFVVVNPGFSVSTAWVYENLALTAGEKISNLESFQKGSSSSAADCHFLGRPIAPDELINDLESVTAGHYREINELKRKLLDGGAIAALMSGSGPTVFGLFPESEMEKASACCKELKRQWTSTFLVEPHTS